jgi:4'-phosphopantetheinyl transferase
MIYIYQSDSAIVKKNTTFEQLLRNLPEFMHERALRYKFEKDGYNFVLGRMLLKEGLTDLGKAEKFENIQYHPGGKPFLKDVFFSISHSDSKVVCAITTQGEIGVDIEKVKAIKLENFNAFFTKKEWTEINSASSPIDKFYWYWTRKESIIKALGVNLSYLHQIEIDPVKDCFIAKKKQWHLRSIDVGSSFVGAICSENLISGLTLL